MQDLPHMYCSFPITFTCLSTAGRARVSQNIHQALCDGLWMHSWEEKLTLKLPQVLFLRESQPVQNQIPSQPPKWFLPPCLVASKHLDLHTPWILKWTGKDSSNWATHIWQVFELIILLYITALNGWDPPCSCQPVSGTARTSHKTARAIWTDTAKVYLQQRLVKEQQLLISIFSPGNIFHTRYTDDPPYNNNSHLEAT